METREGMKTGGAYINTTEPHQHDMAAYEIVGDGPPRSPARATTSQMADDNYFSPLKSQGEREDIGLGEVRDSAHPLEPFDLCGDREVTEEEEEIRNTELAGASTWDNSGDPFTHSPIENITVSGENSGATLFSLRHFPTSPPAPPGRPRSSSMQTTPLRHSKRVRVGGLPAVKDERTPLFTAPVLVAKPAESKLP
jgi:hypothetical protein